MSLKFRYNCFPELSFNENIIIKNRERIGFILKSMKRIGFYMQSAIQTTAVIDMSKDFIKNIYNHVSGSCFLPVKFSSHLFLHSHENIPEVLNGITKSD